MSNEVLAAIIVGVILGTILDLLNNISHLLFDFYIVRNTKVYKVVIGYSEFDTMYDEYYYCYLKHVKKLVDRNINLNEVNYLEIDVIDTYFSKIKRSYNLFDYNSGKFKKEESTLFLLKKEFKNSFFGSDNK